VDLTTAAKADTDSDSDPDPDAANIRIGRDSSLMARLNGLATLRVARPEAVVLARNKKIKKMTPSL
jgi:hypothetical protein